MVGIGAGCGLVDGFLDVDIGKEQIGAGQVEVGADVGEASLADIQVIADEGAGEAVIGRSGTGEADKAGVCVVDEAMVGEVREKVVEEGLMKVGAEGKSERNGWLCVGGWGR